MKLTTKYGTLTGITSTTKYPNGNIKDCTVNEPNKLTTAYGELVPQYEDSGERRKHIHSLSFYDNGNLKSISLHTQTNVVTPAGVFGAELITFHENGEIKRLFPLNGKLTGYWTEEKEYELAENFEFDLQVGSFTQKIIGICFYEDRKIKSITFWPNDVIKIDTPIGSMEGRVGISFYGNGKLKSIEPNKPLYVQTPIGKMLAYDIDPVGVHGDRNSLIFNEDGSIKSLLTSTDKVRVTAKSGDEFFHKPDLKMSILSDLIMQPTPMKIAFYDNKVNFNNDPEHVYIVDQFDFAITNSFYKINNGSSCSGSCSSCSLGVCS